ncbi:aldehyde dehydrogenase family protein [Amycolatopsis rhabdoformis]|uniref:Aldehyde dehydrogenase family protein n=1 Tax=Amycolatopsis rhabdoformis TaxID=1448059 RepID=A0ABZ1IEQ8_9PSEU|nr:aldehyde dehydrogenase family protein [Amycolatopsis rhabdoformis]WSE32574.1 aldehyde dehydrogenase family protein [Amycolatopsis rhabdoformis]
MLEVKLPDVGTWIGGARVAAGGADAEVVLDPATGAELGTVPNASAEDVGAAVAAARRAGEGAWGSATPRQRSEALYRFHAELAGMVERIVGVVVAETGCPVTLARGQQVGLPLKHLEYWAEAARRPELVPKAPVVSGRSDGSKVLGNWVVKREPYGVVAAITPYNFPFLENVMKIGPALAAGNTVVLKPSPFTPYSALLMAEAAAAAGLPAGVLNVVTGGADVGNALVTAPGVDLVSFTGSGAVGSTILAAVAPRMTKVLLELGGKSALIVCDDANIALAARIGFQNIATHAGQGCVLTTRHLVANSVKDAYLERVRAIAGATVVGDPRDPKTGVGPLIREAARERVERAVAGALEQGATVVTGGERPDTGLGGFFYRPTILDGVENTWPVAQQEIFGPVGVVIGYDTDDEAVALANASDFGLAGHVVSAQSGRAFEIAARLKTGTVDLNGGPGFTNPGVPFGGYRQSGLGRENGTEGLDEFTQLKTIKYPAG